MTSEKRPGQASPPDGLRSGSGLSQLTRRSMLGLPGLAVAGARVGAWPRLTGSDIPGRGSKALNIAILGTAADATARQGLVNAFSAAHPDIPVRLQAIQGADWKDFFSKILTMAAAGTPPDVVYVATEGAQLFANNLAEPLDDYVRRDAADMGDYFDDVHPSLLEAFMYQGNMYQLPLDFNAANIYYNTSALQKAGLQRPADDWTKDDFLTVLRAMRRTGGSEFRPYFWT